ncbi:glucosamine-6-phosphate deaminase [Paenibacillus aurantius]|uniref:Glucosamine-6-phosphate deaminase n=1 Tax=Paenibacillus aurantius TaxID=2918900 RepID=A0AA96LHV6_9BACL|nr:glucosamine-6-phosphate deaminase [Paenibacillus aurantius]WNQ12395.1 glucosamine-6-phosphate deaminase [Paenibacillus aurantius]
MNLHIFRTNDDLNEAAAGLFASQLRVKPASVFGLATGSTPIGIYDKLAEWHSAGRVSFARAYSFNLDEYVGLPHHHPESYLRFMEEKLFSRIDMPESHRHIPDGNAESLDEECRRYDELMEDYQTDIQLLGLGHNGHIGFNEPDKSLRSGTHVVELKEDTRRANARFFPSLEEVPTSAVTMGIATIMKAKTILLVVRGADKAEIVHRALTGPITTDCPASLLQVHPSLVVMLDSEAGRLFA